MKLFSALLLVLAFKAFANDDIPNNPPDACWDQCNGKQELLLKEFEEVGVLPETTPAVYSGVCNHNGMYSPDHDHYSVVLLDEVRGNWNYAGIFGYFLPENEYQDWTLERARTEISPYRGDYGNLTIGEGTAKAVVRDIEGKWVYIYWMRQNPVTKDLLLISYAGYVQRSFCRLKKHE